MTHSEAKQPETMEFGAEKGLIAGPGRKMLPEPGRRTSPGSRLSC